MYCYKLVVQPRHVNNNRSYVFLHASEKELSPSANDYLTELVNQKFTNGSFAYLVAISEAEFNELKQTMLEIA
ncbi:hypothetical protein LQ567_07610 [Niabella pedocola]|uniref:Uncharacterized protein n=1 Tax=Niabella pedocola TaxID=1752077 RepID=A0ABS8PNF0_9BACT|nr:hypothetical protein [Niabella pedocola]MCD2422621.1 hypothetical protein [Niabella pedocola]